MILRETWSWYDDDYTGGGAGGAGGGSSSRIRRNTNNDVIIIVLLITKRMRNPAEDKCLRGHQSWCSMGLLKQASRSSPFNLILNPPPP